MWHFAPTREDHQAVANGYKSFECWRSNVWTYRTSTYLSICVVSHFDKTEHHCEITSTEQCCSFQYLFIFSM